jgi:dephospho-CoA kinase
MPLEQKRVMADYVIDNSGTLAETGAQVRNLWSHLMQR